MTEPTPKSDNTQNKASSSNSDTTTNTNSANLIIFGPGQPQMQMEGRTGMVARPVADGQNYAQYLYVTQPGTPFVTASGNSEAIDGSGDSSKPNNGFSISPGLFPPPGNFGDDDIRPDEVAASFTLEAIGGLEEQKAYLKRSIILPLVRPDFLKEWGVSPPKGILLHGPPGTGKTFMAKSLVNELNKELGSKVNFFYRKGGDVFSKWFGESQKKLRQVFAAAKAKSPSIIFFDEIDGLCPSRDGHNHGTEAYASVVTCFLGQMDTLENGKVFVIASTNRLDAVDPAVRRPGRFDKHLAFSFPDEVARQKIIEIHTGKWSKADQPDPNLVRSLAQKTVGFSGADLEKMCKDAVYCAIEQNGGVITANMKVVENHWLQAMSGMQRTAINTFGSALYVAPQPQKIVSQLIKPICEKVIKRISPMLTAISLNMNAPTILKSFLIHITPHESKSFLNNQILPGILCDPIFNKMPIFELKTSTLLNKVLTGAQPNILAGIFDVINQARDAQTLENCSVVVLPNINELLRIAEANSISTKLVLKAIAKIRGPRMFLLATSSVIMEDIKEARVRELFFHRVMSAPNPRENQLNEFFQGLFQEKSTAHPQAHQVYKDAADHAAKLVDNHDYERILSLANALVNVPVPLTSQQTWQATLVNNFQNIFKNF